MPVWVRTIAIAVCAASLTFAQAELRSEQTVQVETYLLDAPPSQAAEGALAPPKEREIEGFPTHVGRPPKLLAKNEVAGFYADRVVSLAPDCSRCLVWNPAGFLVYDGTQTRTYTLPQFAFGKPPPVVWHPNGKRLALQLFATVVVLEPESVAPGPLPKKLNQWDWLDDQGVPHAVAWAPTGELLVSVDFMEDVERVETVRFAGSVLYAIADGGAQRVVYRSESRIDSLRVPRRLKPKQSSYPVLVATDDGALLVNSLTGKPLRRLSTHRRQIPFFRWGPDGTEFVYLRSAARSEEGFSLRAGTCSQSTTRALASELNRPLSLSISPAGTYLVRVDRRRRTWVHLFFDPPPRDLVPQLTILRRDNPGQAVTLVQGSNRGTTLRGKRGPFSRRPLDITGAHMNADETRVAYTAGADVFVYDLRLGKRWRIASFTDGAERVVAAHPRWVGEEVLVNVLRKG